MRDPSRPLETLLVQPRIDPHEVLAAVIDLVILETFGPTFPKYGQMLAASVPDASDRLGQMDRRIRVVTDAEEQYLSVEIVYTTDRAIAAVREVERMRCEDVRGARTGGGKGVRAVATQHAGQPPEGVRDDPESAALPGPRIEGVVVVAAHARHHERSARAHRIEQSRDQPVRTALYRLDMREGGMHQQHAAGFHSEIAQFTRHLPLGDRAPHHRAGRKDGCCRPGRGASNQLVDAALRRRFTLLASVPLFAEYEAVVTRHEHLAAAGLMAAEARIVFDALAAVVEPVRLSYLWRPQLRDVGDDMVLEAATNGRADALVTFNRADFAGSDRFGIRIISPGEALRKIGEIP